MDLEITSKYKFFDINYHYIYKKNENIKIH